MRYIVRKEYFGALIYDKEQDNYAAIDAPFLDKLISLQQGEDIDQFSDKFISMLKKEELLSEENIPNYRIVVNTIKDDILSSPPRIHYYYTSRCNLNCVHCFTKEQEDVIEEDMGWEDRIEFLNQMYELGINEILIGGGEPFIEPDFVDFVDECLKRGINTKVFTNGLLINDKIIERMKNWDLKYLSISVDGTTEEEYKKTRGVEGLHTVGENIKKIKQRCRFPVAISITVNSYNYKTAEDYLKLAYELGADRIKVRPVKPSGNVYNNKQTFLKAEEYAHFIINMQLKWLRDYRNAFKLDFSWGDARLYYDTVSETMNVVNIPFPYKGYGCFAGHASMVIDSHGNALACGFLPKNISYKKDDNILAKSIKEIWDNGARFNALRKNVGNDVCRECVYFGMCRGGCIARILYEGKRMNEVDPWCLKKYFPLNIKEER